MDSVRHVAFPINWDKKIRRGRRWGRARKGLDLEKSGSSDPVTKHVESLFKQPTFLS